MLLLFKALASLRAFCLESTFWHNVKARYLGAYSYDGFSAPLLWQIGEEMPKYMPRIFGKTALQHWWAYKYGAFDEGIGKYTQNRTKYTRNRTK